MIIAGIIVFTLFIVWQAVNRKEPLVPLGLFKDRNFSVSNIAIAAMGAHTLTLAFPTTIYFQQVRGMSPTQAALMTAPARSVLGCSLSAGGKRFGHVKTPNGTPFRGLPCWWLDLLFCAL